MPVLKQFLLPDAGEGLTEAEIVSWKVRAGDVVAVNDVLVEIETAKSLVELPSPFAGVVAQLHVPEGATVDVGTPIVSVDVDPGGSAPEPVPAPAAGSAAEAAPDAGSGAVLVGYGTRGSAARRRRVVRPAPARATPETGAGTPAPSRPDPGTGAGTPAPSRPDPGTGAGTPAPARATPGAGAGTPARVLAKPPVRKLARDLGVDLAAARPTGPGGTVTRHDVLALVPENTTAAEPRVRREERQREKHVPIRGVRKATAQAMVESAFSAPHVTVFTTVDVTRTMKLVQRLKADPHFEGLRISPLLVVAKALLVAVRRNPDVNATWDDEAQVIVIKDYVNLGIAAATPRGLLVPNVKDADAMTLRELAEALGELTRTAREGRTTPADTAGGTITITNIGIFGIDTGTPILNPGEAAILALGRITRQPAVHKGKVKPRWVTTLGLSFDHRMVDGELGSRFLADIAAVLQDPVHALAWG